MEATSYTPSTEDARRNQFLIGRNPAHTRQQIGGCPSAGTLIADSELYGFPIVIALSCKRWGCPHCGRVRVAQLANNVSNAEPNRFVTLTTDAKLWPDGRAAFDGMRRKLPDFTKAIRKLHGSFEYVRILELHKNGMPHWHLLCRCPFIPQPVVSRVWAELTGSVIVDIRMIRQKDHAAKYVLKYMCKLKHIPWTNRRVSWSKHFFPPIEKTKPADWKLHNKSRELDPPELVMHAQFAGQFAERVGPYAWLMRPYTPGSYSTRTT